MLIGSLQAAVVSLLALLQLYETLSENWKIKGNNEIYSLLLISSLTPNIFFQNVTS